MEQEFEGVEHRANPRFPVTNKVWIKIGPKNAHPAKYVKFRTKNLSKMGCLVPCGSLAQQLRLKVNNKLDMVIFVNISDKITKMYNMDAYIRHIQRNGDIGFLIKRKEPEIKADLIT